MLEVESDEIEKLIKEYINSGESALDVLNQGLLAAMDIVGEQWKRDKIYIPEVLMAARNINKGLDILRPLLAEGEFKRKGVFVIGTVKGDIHSIGKDIVATMMEAAGFSVINLGVNLEKETFLKAIDEHEPDIIGLSALLTTTMLEMRDVIATIRNVKGGTAPKIIIGGAPVTQAFADSIGADGYGRDAVYGVEVALKLIRK